MMLRIGLLLFVARLSLAQSLQGSDGIDVQGSDGDQLFGTHLGSFPVSISLDSFMQAKVRSKLIIILHVSAIVNNLC